MRSGFDTTMTPAIMDLINYAIMAKYVASEAWILVVLAVLR